ncbi:hypothetical protein BD779DRAFT_1789370 [Infundibulicybe gibba]|nr:hypothetical protein BD779DRAFT_1789370 [Infundibulicybe gibba]
MVKTLGAGCPNVRFEGTEQHLTGRTRTELRFFDPAKRAEGVGERSSWCKKTRSREGIWFVPQRSVSNAKQGYETGYGRRSNLSIMVGKSEKRLREMLSTDLRGVDCADMRRYLIRVGVWAKPNAKQIEWEASQPAPVIHSRLLPPSSHDHITHLSPTISSDVRVLQMAKPTTSIPELTSLSELIEKKPESFALGETSRNQYQLWKPPVRTELESKSHINGLLSSLTLSDAPQTLSRSHANVESHRPPSPLTSRLTFGDAPLSTPFVDGMDEDQIWAPLDLRTKSIWQAAKDESDNEDMDGAVEQKYLRALQALENGEQIDLEDLQGVTDGKEDIMDDEDAFLDKSGSEDEHMDKAQDKEENIVDYRDSSSDEESDDDDPSSLLDVIAKKPNQPKKPKSGARTRPNAETEQAEAKSSSRGHLCEDGEDEDDNMSVDLFAPVDPTPEFDKEDLERDPGVYYVLQETLYKDLFESPPRILNQKSKKVTSPTKASRVRFHEEVRVRKIKATGKNLPLSNEENDEEVGEDIDGSEDNELLLEQMLSDGTLEVSGSGAEDSDSEASFDDVVRIRPIDDKPFLPSRFFELEDIKSSRTLVQMHEDEYLGGTISAVEDDRDGKLKKEHTESENL